MHQSLTLPLQTGMVLCWWQWGPYMKKKRGVEKRRFITIISISSIIIQSYQYSCNANEWARPFSISPFLEMHTWSIICTFLIHNKALSRACNNDTLSLVAIVKTAKELLFSPFSKTFHFSTRLLHHFYWPGLSLDATYFSVKIYSKELQHSVIIKPLKILWVFHKLLKNPL